MARAAANDTAHMAKFCFVVHPLSFDDVARYEPGAKGKGRPIIAKILEWMPAHAAAHVSRQRCQQVGSELLLHLEGVRCVAVNR